MIVHKDAACDNCEKQKKHVVGLDHNEFIICGKCLVAAITAIDKAEQEDAK